MGFPVDPIGKAAFRRESLLTQRHWSYKPKRNKTEGKEHPKRLTHSSHEKSCLCFLAAAGLNKPLQKPADATCKNSSILEVSRGHAPVPGQSRS